MIIVAHKIFIDLFLWDMKKAPVSRSHSVIYIAGVPDASPPKSFQFYSSAKVPYAMPLKVLNQYGLRRISQDFDSLHVNERERL